MILLLLSLLARPAAAADDPKRAKELFQEGTTFFDVGQFDKAIEAWQAGYKAKPDPGFLYNIAQAYRIAGDPNKAIFFYRGYLRNSPNAENRTEVEQKIAALQKQVAELDRNKPSVPPPATTPPPPAAASSTPPPPPPLAAADPTTAVPPSAPTTYPSATLAPPRSAGTADVAAAAPPAGDEAPGHFDLTAVLGLDTWQEGFQGAAQPSFAFVIGGGYTLGGRPDRRLQFHVGALIGYTFLSEKESTPKFWSWMVEPMLRYRLGERWALSGALGIGVLAISGLAPNSVLLKIPTDGILKVTGTQSLLVTRPALGVEFRLTDSLAILMTFAFPYSPQGENFYGPIRRSEVLFGLGYHL